MLYDLVVVGGGPAGAVAGATAAKLGLRTLIVESAVAPRWKPGESLPPECNPLLKRLGLFADLLTHTDVAIRSAGIRSAWGSSEFSYRDAFAEPNGPGWIIDRSAFERLLFLRAVDAGAEWRWGLAARSVFRIGSSWHFAFDGSGCDDLRAAFVIDATGRPARIARRLGASRLAHTKQLAKVSVGRIAHPIERPWIHVESTFNGWSYSTVGPGGLIVATDFCDRVMRDSQSHKAHRLERFEIEWRESAIVDAGTAALSEMGGDGWIAVGDAATAFDPISSQGLSQALASGEEGAAVAAEHLAGDRAAVARYSKRMQATYANTIIGLIAHYRAETRWLTEHFWRRRHAF